MPENRTEIAVFLKVRKFTKYIIKKLGIEKVTLPTMG